MKPPPKNDSSETQTTTAREAALLAPYAIYSCTTAGRKHEEPEHAYRGPFQRDRDRILHSAAFRRLSYKTQVFTGEMGDYHRTRLTHTLEVASIARTLARALRLNEDLVEALALAHDIGHPPFGHAGEDTLAECLASEGGFNHNRQALRILELLETRYGTYPGLNLSAEVLAGQSARAAKESGQTPPLEVQLVDAADSIAYDTHDVDDALELGLVSLPELFELPLWREATQRVSSRYASIRGDELCRAVVHELIDSQVSDLLAVSQRRIEKLGIDSPIAAQAAEPAITPSAELSEKKRGFESFLYERVYRHPKVLAMRAEAQGSLATMFEGYLNRFDLLPEKFQRLASEFGPSRAVGDYLAGMTDRFAQHEYRRLFANKDS